MRRRGRLAGLLVLALVSGGALVWQGSHRQVPLHQDGVTRDAWGELVAVAPGRAADGWLPLSTDGQTRPVEVSVLSARAAGRQAWLASGWQPSVSAPHRDLVRSALEDLHLLTAPTGAAPGAVLAGASPAWRFVWPRDASFAAVALARSGHEEDALEVLLLLQDLQATDGSLQARYVPLGDGSFPDERPAQEDGPGWALWAAREVVDTGMPGATPEDDPARSLAPLVTRSTARLLDRLDPQTGLPRPSPDYWERPEEKLTLGIAATSLMGLEAAADLHARGAVPEREWRAAGVDPATLTPTAAAVRERIVDEFGPSFPRHLGGRPDAAVTFLLPPFVDEAVPGAELARRRSQAPQRRPAGGLAPGAGWRNDGVSWTPETALQAVAAAHTGRAEEAGEWLDWLDEHRTDAGALPEKVLHDGDPAAVAPLAWTAALVVLAARP